MRKNVFEVGVEVEPSRILFVYIFALVLFCFVFSLWNPLWCSLLPLWLRYTASGSKRSALCGKGETGLTGGFDAALVGGPVGHDCLFACIAFKLVRSSRKLSADHLLTESSNKSSQTISSHKSHLQSFRPMSAP